MFTGSVSFDFVQAAQNGSVVACLLSLLPASCRLHTLAGELDLPHTSAGREASDAVQPSATTPAAAAPSLLEATGSRGAHVFCLAVWQMLGDHNFLAALHASQSVVTWAVDHFAALVNSSKTEHGSSWSPSNFGAVYVPSKHVVSDLGTTAVPSNVEQLHMSFGVQIQRHG
jgi:hypothetical protein